MTDDATNEPAHRSANSRVAESEVVRAAKRRIIPSVAAVVAEGGRRVFSGCFVAARGQQFLLTARHCARFFDDPDDVRLISDRQRRGTRPVLSGAPLIRVSSDDDALDPDRVRFDIALIPLATDYAAFLDAAWIGLDRLSSQGVGASTPVLLVGFPWQLREEGRTGTGASDVRVARIQFLGSVTDEYPSNLIPEPNRDVDLFVHYDFDDMVTIEEDMTMPPLRPGGLSGCGVFALRGARGDDLWQPGELPLCAVQSGFIERHSILRATRADVVGELIEEFFLRRE